MPTLSKINPPFLLANHVFKYLDTSDKLLPDISQSLLDTFFSVLYYSSMKSEEGQMVNVIVTFFDPELKYTDLPEEDSIDHWRFTPFETPLDFDIKSLTKLSKAADPWSTSVAVYFNDRGELLIYGLIDQTLHNQRFINYESEIRPKSAGFFDASIQGIGLISVTADFKLIGILRQNSLVTHFLDVFRIGQISELVNLKSKSIITSIDAYIRRTKLDVEIDDYLSLIENVWRGTISRILIQIKKYNHGGALLITSSTDGLDINYPLPYRRLRTSIIRLVKIKIRLNVIGNEIDGLKLIRRELIDEQRKLEYQKNEIDNELKGAIRFIASQSCVDGLIVLNDDFTTFGFGAIIENVDPPEKVFVSSAAKFNSKNIVEKDNKNFGTRHKSMMTFCNNNPGSIGIVISQDGDLRVMSKFIDKLIIWENVKTQKYFRPPLFPFRVVS